MPNPRIKIRDLDHPDFKHGTTTGYQYGCRATYPCPASPTCIEANRADAAVRRATHLAARPPEKRLYRPGPLSRHLQRLVDADWGIPTITLATGIAHTTLYGILRKQSNVTFRLAQRILSLNDENLSAGLAGKAAYIPLRLIRWKIQSLYALGYSFKTQARRANVHVSSMRRFAYEERSRHVEVKTYERTCAMFDDWSAALPPTGRTSDATRADAARRGWYTPEFYTLDGRLMDEVDWDGSLDERYARRDRLATERLTILYRSLRNWESSDKLATALNVHEDLVSRYRTEAGLRFRRPPHGSDNFGLDIELKPGFEERAAFVMEVLRRWEANPLGDPYHYCLELGLMIDKKFRLVKRSRKNVLVAA